MQTTSAPTPPSVSAAGRVLFARSRAKKTSSNDADRLRKYLAGHGPTFSALSRGRIERPLLRADLDATPPA